MKPDIIAEFETTGEISSTAIQHLTAEEGARHELYLRYIQDPSIDFARALLRHLTDHYKRVYQLGSDAMGTDELRLAAYLIGLNGDVSDSLVLWQTKQINFDTACEFDIQLVVFAGATPTITYLKQYGSQEANEAAEYIEQCNLAGDFDSLDEYYSPTNLPYWI